MRMKVDVTTLGNPQRKMIGATIWEKYVYGQVGRGSLRAIRGRVRALTDKFCNDYVQANAKQGQPDTKTTEPAPPERPSK